MAKNLTIEEGFEQLSDIMGKIEAHDVSLEESFAMYHKGIKLVKQLKDKLDDTEKKLMILEDQE